VNKQTEVCYTIVIERFNLKEITDVEIKEQCRIKISKRFESLEWKCGY
jgi:hypothetical protein